MGIANASINIDGTVATTGGTATTLKEIGRNLDTFSTFLNDSASFQLRTVLEFSTKSPKVLVSAPGGYSQARSTFKILKPKMLANGNRTVNTGTITLSVDPETSAAEVASLLVTMAQALADSDFSDFWKSQSLS